MYKDTLLTISGFAIATLIGWVAWLLMDKIKKVENTGKEKQDKNTCLATHKGLGQNIQALREDISFLKRLSIGDAKSPLKLKEKYKEVILSSDLPDQIKNKEEKIIDLVKRENPKTAFDAQKIIDCKIGDIMGWFDLTDYKNKLYQAGVPVGVEDGIIAIYLYELVIPKIFKS